MINNSCAIMGISTTGSNEFRLITFMFTIKRGKNMKKHQYYCYKTNKQTKMGQRQPTCLINSLHIFQGQLGTQLAVRALNFSRDFYFLQGLCHSFGPSFAVSVLFPLSVHGMLRLNLDWFFRLKDVCRFCIQNGDCKQDT